MKKVSYMYSGRMAGKQLYAHQYFKNMALTLKEGQTLGIPMEHGIAIYEFKGIKRPPEPKIWVEGL